MSRLVMVGTTRVKAPRQTPAEAQAVYDHVTARDVTCRALVIDPFAGSCGAPGVGPFGPGRLERHHAGNTTGSKRKTDLWHVVLLCRSHHQGGWAGSHDRLILDYLRRIEPRP